MKYLAHARFLKQANMWNLTPYRVLGTEMQGSRVNILLPRFRPGWLNIWFKPFINPERKYIRIILDDFGSMVWNSCNGSNTVEEIFQLFIAHYANEPDEAQLRLHKFLLFLYRERYISFRELG